MDAVRIDDVRNHFPALFAAEEQEIGLHMHGGLVQIARMPSYSKPLPGLLYRASQSFRASWTLMNFAFRSLDAAGISRTRYSESRVFEARQPGWRPVGFPTNAGNLKLECGRTIGMPTG